MNNIKYTSKGKERGMKVVLAKSNEKEDLHKIYTACRTCYNAGSPVDMYEDETIDDEKKIKLIKQVISSGHGSVLEHVPLTFFIEGVSRSLLAQISRHRIGVSLSVQSQRYVEFEDGKFNVVAPYSIASSKVTVDLFNECIAKISETYRDLVKFGVPAEDARAVLPNACTTNISITMNLRSFLHFCEERCCTCAQKEIRVLANIMASLVKERFPFLKDFIGPKCLTLGYCNEPKKRSCGRAPLKNEVLSTEEVSDEQVCNHIYDNLKLWYDMVKDELDKGKEGSL